MSDKEKSWNGKLIKNYPDTYWVRPESYPELMTCRECDHCLKDGIGLWCVHPDHVQRHILVRLTRTAETQSQIRRLEKEITKVPIYTPAVCLEAKRNGRRLFGWKS